MNTVIAENPAYVPIQYLATTLTTVAANNATLTKILQKSNANSPSEAEIKSIFDIAMEHADALVADPTLLTQAYTMIFQLLFQSSATSTQQSPLLAEYLPRIAVQLSTAPDVETKAKVALLQFAYGQIQPQNPLIYPITKAILTLLGATYQSPQQLQSESFRSIENILAAIPANVSHWSLSPVETAYILNVTAAYTTHTSTPFASRELLSAAYQQLGRFDQAILEANQSLVSSIVESFFTIVFTTPSYQVCLDEFLAYETVLESPFTQTDYFKQHFPLFSQLLDDFIVTSTIAQVESLVTSPRWVETANKFQQLNVEVLRTNLLALLVAEKLQAGKGFRFSTLQTYYNLSSTDEVEEYIVEATTHGQISTKIDQVEQIVHVSRVVPRKFNPEKSWGDIQSRLQYFIKVISHFETDYAKRDGKGMAA